MNEFIERLKNEPALLGGLVVAFLMTLAAWKVLEVTPEQLTETENLITLGVTFFLPLVSGLAVRSQVTPTGKIEGAAIEPA